MTTVTNDPRRELSDRAVAILRTSVPVWWGSLVTWLLVSLATLLPAELLEPLEELLRSEPAKALATVAVTLVWYLLWRWLAPRIPDWLLRLALGSTRTPVYPGTRDAIEFDQLLTEKAAAGLTPELVPSLRSLQAALADTLDPDDPTPVVLERVLTALDPPQRRHDDDA